MVDNKRYPNPRWVSDEKPEGAGHETLWLVHIPGTGGTSIRQAIDQWGGRHHCYTHHTASKLRQVFAAARSKQLFAVIRDPCERALKAWAWAKRAGTWSPLYRDRPEETVLPLMFDIQEDPNLFFERVKFRHLAQIYHHFTPQFEYLDAPDIELIRFNDLQGGLDGLVEKYGGSRIVLGERRESASGRPPVSILSDKAKERIDEFYKEDWALTSGLSK